MIDPEDSRPLEGEQASDRRQRRGGIAAATLARAWAHFQEQQSALVAPLLLLVLVVALFAETLTFVPAQADDLVLLSSVANTANPLHYFVADSGLGYGLYRPLHSAMLWVTYRIFGISAAPDHLINLGLHCVIVLLLWRVIQRLQPDRSAAWLATALAAASIYTMSPVSWASDRPTLLVAVALLLALDHLLSQRAEGPVIRVWYIAALLVFALMGKESGLVVVALVLYAATQLALTRRMRAALIGVAVASVAAYTALRIAIFGARATAYRDGGYLFGLIAYGTWDDLPPNLRVFAPFDNVAKHLLAVVLPIFANTGALREPRDMLWSIFVWLPTLLICLLAASRKLVLAQRYALVIVLANAVSYFAEFRYRALYMAQIAFCLFIAASPVLWRGTKRNAVAKGLAVMLLFASIFAVSQWLNTLQLQWNDDLQISGLQQVVERYRAEAGNGGAPIDERIIEQVLAHYR